MPLPAPNESPTLADMVNDAIATALYRLRTTQPGHVVSYDAKTNTATVQAAIQEGDFDQEGARVTKTPPPISGCPVHFIGGADFWISTPIKPGTPGLIVSCSSSMDAWSGAPAGTIVDPKNDERHHLSNSVFIPGIRPPKSAIGGGSGPPDDAIVINGAKVLLGDSSATGVPAFNSDVNNIIQAILACTPSGTETGLTAIKLAITTAYPTPPVGATKVRMK